MRYAWLKPPTLRPEAESDASRRASWFEVFCDLVFVAALSQLGSALRADPSAAGLIRYLGFFVPV